MPKVAKDGYIASLVRDTLEGDSNAFAVLFSATYQNLYRKCYAVVEDEYAAQDIMFSTYVIAYRDLKKIQDFDSFIPWIDSINSGQLLRILRRKTPGGTVSPFYFNSARFQSKLRKVKKEMSLDNAGQLLESIFFQIDREPNDIPIETLHEYYLYRSNSFALQWFIIAVILVLFVLLPFYFIKPNFTMEFDAAKSTPKEAIHNIEVKGIIPIRTVIATVDGTQISVMQDDNRLYSTSAALNGNLEVTVTLFNGQQKTLTDTITIVDREKPTVISHETKGDRVELYVKDDGYGVDYPAVAGVSSSSLSAVYPISSNENTGQIIFPYPDSDTEIVIPDKAGNSLKILLSPN